MRQRYVSSLIEHQDREILIAGLWVITGYHQEPLLINKKCKKTTTYSS